MQLIRLDRHLLLLHFGPVLPLAEELFLVVEFLGLWVPEFSDEGLQFVHLVLVQGGLPVLLDRVHVQEGYEVALEGQAGEGRA